MADLIITVVAADRIGPEIDLSHEATLVKGALLYADEVRLVSIQAVSIMTVASAYAAPPAIRRQFLEKILSDRDPASAELMRQVTELRTKGGKTTAEVLRLAQLEELIRAGGEMTLQSLAGILAESGLGELMPAMDAGLLKFDPLGADQGLGLDEGLPQRFTDLLSSLLAAGSDAYPLLDDHAGRMARTLMGDQGPQSVASDRAREVRLAGEFIGSMPAFPDAPMAAVLEARAELQPALIRFRAAVIDLASTVEAFPGEPDYPQRVEQVWRTEVEPALLELRELEQGQRVRSLLRHSLFGTSLGSVGGAALGLVGFTSHELASILLGLAVKGADIAQDMRNRHMELADERRNHKFGFLFELDRDLSSS